MCRLCFISRCFLEVYKLRVGCLLHSFSSLSSLWDTFVKLKLLLLNKLKINIPSSDRCIFSNLLRQWIAAANDTQGQIAACAQGNVVGDGAGCGRFCIWPWQLLAGSLPFNTDDTRQRNRADDRLGVHRTAASLSFIYGSDTCGSHERSDQRRSVHSCGTTNWLSPSKSWLRTQSAQLHRSFRSRILDRWENRTHLNRYTDLENKFISSESKANIYEYFNGYFTFPWVYMKFLLSHYLLIAPLVNDISKFSIHNSYHFTHDIRHIRSRDVHFQLYLWK